MLFVANLLGDVVHLCDPHEPVALQHPVRKASVLPHMEFREEAGMQRNPDLGPSTPWEYLAAPTLTFKEIS